MQRASCIVPAPVGAALCAAVRAVRGSLILRRGKRGAERGTLRGTFNRRTVERGKHAAWFRASHFAALAARQFRRVRGVERGRKRGRNSRRFTRRFCTVQRGTLRGTFAALVSRSAALCAAVFIERGKRAVERGRQRGGFHRARQAAWFTGTAKTQHVTERGKNAA